MVSVISISVLGILVRFSMVIQQSPLLVQPTVLERGFHRRGVVYLYRIRDDAATPSGPMATARRVSRLPFGAATLLLLLLAGGAAADEASSDDDAGAPATPGCSNKFQLVMARAPPEALPSELIRSLVAVAGYGLLKVCRL